MSVPNTLKVIADVQSIALAITALVKDGKISFLDFPQFLALFSEFTQLAADLPAALAELKTLNAVDAGTLTTALYGVGEAEIAALGITLPATATTPPGATA